MEGSNLSAHRGLKNGGMGLFNNLFICVVIL